MKKIIFLFLGLILHFNLFTQTVGLLSFSNETSDGYTIIDGNNSKAVYLIDNCGELINKWDLARPPGLMSYIMPDGSLIRCERESTVFGGGGFGGRISKYNWNGQETWSALFSNDLYQQHHDIDFLPNGNVLLLLWQRIPESEALAKGRYHNITEEYVWSSRVIEIKLMGTTDFTIVWEWNAWDHLVQDADAAKPNFGSIQENPRRININYIGPGVANSSQVTDWMHMNSIDYDEELDQIVLSSRHFGEAWIIDHSTTTEEAKGESGGNAGLGGNLLYRWGNPDAYQGDLLSNQKLFGQHDVNWITIPDSGKKGLSIFNNGYKRIGPDYSELNIIELPLSGYNYFLEPNGTFGPTTFNTSISTIDGNSFYISKLCGVQLLENGNLLASFGAKGELFEVNPATQESVWSYVFPVNGEDPMTQGDPPNNNLYFKSKRYPSDYPGFDGIDLTPKGPIELMPIPNDCVVSGIVENSPSEFKIYPNPSRSTFEINSKLPYMDIRIFNASGQLLWEKLKANSGPITVNGLESGIYFVKINDEWHKQIIYN